MAFSLVASVGDESISLSDGNPFKLESAQGLSGASVARHQQRGPLQGGVSDLGYRLQARAITLNLLFRADTDAALDAHRDTLLSALKPLAHTGVTLTVTRDDGAVRKLVCHAAGEIAIGLVPTDRPGRLHRAKVQLRAADPLWQSGAATTGALDYGTVDPWWLAGGAIGENQVLHRVEYPDAGEGWNIGTTIPWTGETAWGVALVTERFNSGTVEAWAWLDTATTDGWLNYTGTAERYTYNRNTNSGNGYLWPGIHAENFHAMGHYLNGFWHYLSGGTVAVYHGATTADVDLGDHGIWRRRKNSDDPAWGPIRRAMIWKQDAATGGLTNGQALSLEVAALGPIMIGNTLGSAYTGTVSVTNSGDVAAYPIISLQGPIQDPVITNVTTGDVIDLTGLTVPREQTYTMDLRDGNKTIVDGSGSDVMGNVSTVPIDMADFALAPSPTATGGTNVITVTTGSAGMNSIVSFDFTEKYTSF